MIEKDLRVTLEKDEEMQSVSLLWNTKTPQYIDIIIEDYREDKKKFMAIDDINLLQLYQELGEIINFSATSTREKTTTNENLTEINRIY
jgi:hypothetical protein